MSTSKPAVQRAVFRGAPLSVVHAVDWLEDHGFTILRTKSYLAAQERQRLAEVNEQWQREARERAEAWARDSLREERRMRDRVSLVYSFLSEDGRLALREHDGIKP